MIESWIAEDYSPELISGKAKLETKMCVSHKCIHQYIWEDKKHKGELYKHVRRNGRRYRKRGEMKDSRGLIKNKVIIDKRPEIVNKKERFGFLFRQSVPFIETWSKSKYRWTDQTIHFQKN